MPQLVGDDVVRLAKEIEKGRRFLAQSRAYLYVCSGGFSGGPGWAMAPSSLVCRPKYKINWYKGLGQSQAV